VSWAIAHRSGRLEHSLAQLDVHYQELPKPFRIWHSGRELEPARAL
jgi:hypothetical protein